MLAVTVAVAVAKLAAKLAVRNRFDWNDPKHPRPRYPYKGRSNYTRP